MKKIIMIISMGLLPFSVFADENFAKKDINEIKEKIISKIDKKILKMQESKQCIMNATNKEELRKCKPKKEEHEKEEKSN